MFSFPSSFSSQHYVLRWHTTEAPTPRCQHLDSGCPTPGTMRRKWLFLTNSRTVTLDEVRWSGSTGRESRSLGGGGGGEGSHVPRNPAFDNKETGLFENALKTLSGQPLRPNSTDEPQTSLWSFPDHHDPGALVFGLWFLLLGYLYSVITFLAPWPFPQSKSPTLLPVSGLPASTLPLLVSLPYRSQRNFWKL